MYGSAKEAAQQASRGAGLGKGTTVVDNDLINVAFMSGAGIAIGYVLEALDVPESLGHDIGEGLFAFLNLCLEAGNDAT